jgi:hypothetical protein
LPLQTNGLHVGLPVEPAATVAHVPFVVAPAATEHAWQLPLHVLLQQKPSTHGFAPHSRQPLTLQSATRLHVPPWVLIVWQLPAALQKSPAMQSLSLAHPPGQPGPAPHTSGEQTPPRPVVPVSALHVPFTVPPCAIEHAWQLPPHALLQQKPSTHGFAPHSRQPLTLQSVTRLHVPPWLLIVWQLPAALQKSPAMQSLSLAHPPGHPGPAPHTSGEQTPPRPVVPVSALHVPFVVPPCAIEHAWQLAPHATLQQKPSTQPPAVPHSRQPETLHCVTVLHDAPPLFWAVHVPVLSQ